MDKVKSLFMGKKSGAAWEEDRKQEPEMALSESNTFYGNKLMIGDEEKEARISRLTARERDVLLPLLAGYTLKETAKQLGISYSTANTHQSAIYKKLEINTKAELIINFRQLRNKDG